MPLKECVLIVDDVLINRKILVNMLEKKYITLEAQNGQEALKMMMEKSKEISMVLLDLSMPIMNGYTFLKEVAKRPKLKRIPIIVLTSEDTAEDEAKALELGAKDFIPKPYQIKVIELRMNKVKMTFQKEQRLEYEVRHDVLTKLYNRRGFEEAVNARLKKGQVKEAGFLLLDITKLKQMNTEYGFSYGDKVLQNTAKFLLQLKNENTLIGRLGDDEFGVLFTDIIDTGEVVLIGRDLEKSWGMYMERKHNMEMLCTVGIASYPLQGTSALELYQSADETLDILRKRKTKEVMWSIPHFI